MAKKIPSYAYTGAHYATADNTYWYIYLTGSGTFTFSYPKTIDVFLVGGGAGGMSSSAAKDGGVGGGGGGYTKTVYNVYVPAQTGNAVAIGAGGGAQANGGPTSAFANSVAGGTIGSARRGGNGGSGGGAGGNPGGRGGSNGANGANSGDGNTTYGGTGQGSTTCEFGDTSRTRYGGGGGGGTYMSNANNRGIGSDGGGNGGWDGGSPTNGAANTGGGGGGAGKYVNGGAGGSGVVIIRGTQDDLLPVVYNGTQLSKIVYNGVAVTSLVYNGIRIYMRRMAQGIRRMAHAVPLQKDGKMRRTCT